MKQLSAFEMSVTIYQSTQRNIPEEFNLKKEHGSAKNLASI